MPGGWRQEDRDHSAWINHLSLLPARSVSSLKTETVPDNPSAPPARTPYWEQPLEAHKLSSWAYSPKHILLPQHLQLCSPRPLKGSQGPSPGFPQQAQAFITGTLNSAPRLLMFPSYSCFRLSTPKGRDLLSSPGYHPFFSPSPKHRPGWHPAGTPKMSAGWMDGWMGDV